MQRAVKMLGVFIPLPLDFGEGGSEGVEFFFVVLVGSLPRLACLAEDFDFVSDAAPPVTFVGISASWAVSVFLVIVAHLVTSTQPRQPHHLSPADLELLRATLRPLALGRDLSAEPKDALLVRKNLVICVSTKPQQLCTIVQRGVAQLVSHPIGPLVEGLGAVAEDFDERLESLILSMEPS